MDGRTQKLKPRRGRPTSVRRRRAWLVLVTAFASLTAAEGLDRSAIGQVPLDTSISAVAITDSSWTVDRTATIVRPPAKTLSSALVAIADDISRQQAPPNPAENSNRRATATALATATPVTTSPPAITSTPAITVTPVATPTPVATSTPVTTVTPPPASIPSIAPTGTVESFASSQTVEQALATRGSVTFRKTPIGEVVFLLSDLWQINIVAGENVSGEVSGTFHNAPLSEVLAAVLTSSGYSYRKTGSSLVVLSADRIGVNDPSFVSQTLRLPESLREDASTLEAARLMLSERGDLKKIGTDLVLVIDNPERIERVRGLFESLSPFSLQSQSQSETQTQTQTQTQIQSLPTPTSTALLSGVSYFSPQYTEASELALPLQQALGDQVNVAVYAQENRLMVRGTPDDLQLAAEIIAQLDRPRAQVRITAMIYDVNLTELEQLGVDWGRDLAINTMQAAGGGAAGGAAGAAGAAAAETLTFSDALGAASLTTTGATSFGLRRLGSTFDTSVFIRALDQSSEAKLLADPSITVGDRREASIRIVRRIPIVGANPVQGSNAVFTQTEFEEAGVILRVQPRISRDGTIELIVAPEYSVLVENSGNGPVIDSREAQTTVRVANGQMFVLGGLRQKDITETVNGVPFLRDIKFIGKLFQSHNTLVRESELIVFLKPEIVTPYFDGDPRQQRAACVANSQLDQIPYADFRPQTPCCSDPYCPNHNPRPRLNGGSAMLGMIDDDAVYFPLASPTGATVDSVITPEPIVTGGDDFYPPIHIAPTRMN